MLRRRGLSYLARCFPHLFWLWYGKKAKRLGLKRLYLVLSFDCDTPEDIEASDQLDAWLRQRKIKSTYAVPGKQLEQGADVYRRLAERGADFINHGALPHTEWRGGRYWSINFYNEMSNESVVEDIQRGHEIVKRVIGRTPTGFRAPHFGYFQAPEQLKLLHTTLKKLGYLYSTSTLPEFGLRHGPAWEGDGFYEIPLSGSYHSFFGFLDSWGYIISPYDPILQDEYAKLFIQTVERLLTLGISGVLNYYVDPSHVYKSEAFFQAMDYVIERQIPTLRYGELIGLIKGRCDEKFLMGR